MFADIIFTIRKIVTEIQAGFLYTSLIIVLAVISFGFLVYSFLPGARSDIVDLSSVVDLTVAYIFIVDFCLGLFFNNEFKDKKHYWKENWQDFVSSAPITSEVTHVLRLLRIWQAWRVIRMAVRIWNAKKQAVTIKDFLTD